MTGVGMTYEGNPESQWDIALRCTVHDAYEMFHTCAGGPGEPLGYCKNWDGTLLNTTEKNGRRYGGHPNCEFEVNAT